MQVMYAFKFQFQQGSIITSRYGGQVGGVCRFQFQQGSIITLSRKKSGDGLSTVSNPTRFNYNRLAVVGLCGPMHGFNSNKVQL